jgi:SAM-dependent methyltransferase
MKNDELILKKSGEYWSKVTKEAKTATRKSWGHSKVIHEFLVKKILPGGTASSPIIALFLRYEALYGKNKFNHGVSIGCGNASRELAMMERGLVDSFDFYEMSAERLKQIESMAAEKGLSDRVKLNSDDALAKSVSEKYDLVFWCHSLHHMLDTKAAVEWSRDAMVQGGALIMYDFVGASRFQWSDQALQYASAARCLLPEKYLQNPDKPGSLFPTVVKRPSERKLIARDPTEAADSDNILGALEGTFNSLEIVPLGGIIYHLGLNELFTNILNDPEHHDLLAALLQLDAAIAKRGLNNFAAAFAKK